MILDIAVILIFAISTILGRRHGFLETVLRLRMLVASLVAGVLLTERVSELLMLTGMDEWMLDRLSAHEADGQLDLASLIPGRIGETISDITNGIFMTTAKHFTNLVVTTTAFILIVLTVAAITSLLRRKVHRSKMQKGFIGTVDDGVGLMIGGLRGVILVCLFLAFLLPMTGIFAPERINDVSMLLNESVIAGRIYDINPLIAFMRGFNL